MAGGAETPVLGSVSLAVASFVVSKDGIYYVCPVGVRLAGPQGYRFFDFSTAKSRVLTQFKADGGQGLTVSPDGRTMLYGFASGQQSDLMLVENFR